MGRRTTSTSYVTPILSTGVVQTESATEFGRGSYTLTVGTYYYPLGGQDTPITSVHMQHDAAAALVATIEDCNMFDSEVSWFSDNGGEWLAESPTTAYVPVDGATTTATNGVVTVVAGNLGGAMWHVADTGARRTRLKVVVSTGGEVRVATWGKE